MINNLNYGYTTFKSVKTNGEYVLIKKAKPADVTEIDGVYVPSFTPKKHLNERIGAGQILDVGGEVTEKYGVKAGDFVLYDYYSANGDWEETIFTKAENLIMLLTEDDLKDFLKGKLEG